MRGARYVLGNLATTPIGSLSFPMILVVILLIFRMIVRNQKAAVGILVVVAVLTGDPIGADPLFALGFNLLGVVAVLVLLFRCGLLSLAVAAFTQNFLNSYPLSPDLTVWYGTSTLLVALVFAALTAYSLRIALAGRSIYRDPIFSG